MFSPEDVLRLVAFALANPEPHFMRIALRAATDQRIPNVIEQALTSTAVSERSLVDAFECLGRFDIPESLTPLLEHKDLHVSGAAAAALGKVGRLQDNPALERASRSPHQHLKVASTWAIDRIRKLGHIP